MKTVQEKKLKLEKKSKLRKLSASVSILGLLYSTSAIAAEKKSTVDIIDQVFNTTMQQMQQSMQQTQMQNQQSAMMAQLQPKTIPSKFFPHCKISQARGAFPKRACETGIASPMELQGVEQMANLGSGYADMYDQLLSPAQNTSYPVGLQCLEDAKKGMTKSLQDRLNSLQTLKDKIEKEAQYFTEKNKKLLSDMDKSHKELFGGGSADIDARTRDFSKYFSSDCQNIIGQDNLNKAASVGLNGIKVGLQTKNKSAVDYSVNQSTIERDLNKQIQTVKNQIQSQGIEQWREDVAKGNSSINGQDLARMGVNKPAVNIVMTEINRFDSKVSTIQKELKKIDPDYEIPPMDKNFGVDFAEFTKGAENFFKKKYINECVTMADKGVAISPDQILSSLTSGVGGKSSIALKNYKAALSNILNSDAFIEDKMAQIQALDKKYERSNISITYKDGGSQTVKSTTYDLYRNTVASCEQRFTQNDTFSTGGQKSVSQQKKIKRAKKYLNDLKDLEATFAAQIGNKIYDSVINCSGRSQKSNTCSNGDIFNQDSDAFCMKHATNCSVKVQQCYKQANAHVEKKKADIKSMQATYNKNVAALVAREEAYLKQVKAQVLADAEYLNRYFPGANYSVPEGLFIKMPEKSESEFGVELAGGGSLDFMKDLPSQITKLKNTLQQQSSNIEGVIDQYIADQRGAMEQQKQKWDNLSDQCHAAAQQFRAQVAQQNAEMQKAQQEQMGAIGQFCNKYGQLGNSNPLAGCDDGSDHSAQSLYEDMSGVVQGISREHEMSTSEYRNACARFNNEREAGSEDDDDEDSSKKSSLADICRKSGNKTAKVNKKLIELALSGLPSDLSKHESSIKKYIKNEISESSLNKKVRESDYKDEVLDQMRDLYGENSEPDEDKFNEKISGLINGEYPDKMKEKAEAIVNKLKQEQAKLADDAAKEAFRTANSALINDVASIESMINKPEAELSEALRKFATAQHKLGGSDFYSLKSEDYETSSEASDEMKALLGDIKDDFKSENNFCSTHSNDALLAAVKSCLKDDKAEKCVEKEWRNNKKNETSATKEADRAIASITDSSFEAEWQRIGERTKDVDCQAASENQRGIDHYFKQMQQIGGADFSGQRGFGQ
jgi:hypothetical protein